MRKALVAASLAAAVSVASLNSACHADVVIGNWNNQTPDGWFDWATSSPPPPAVWTYADPTGGENFWGEYSLLYQPAGPNGRNGGYNQSVATKLEDRDLMSDWWAYNALQITITYPSAASADSTSGYSQIYQLAINAPGWGFNSIGGNPVPASEVYYSAGTPQQTITFDVPYTAVLSAMSAAGYNATTNQGYADIIFATNSGSGAPGSVYFDQISLVTVPEPTAGALGLAAVAGAVLKRRLKT